MLSHKLVQISFVRKFQDQIVDILPGETSIISYHILRRSAVISNCFESFPLILEICDIARLERLQNILFSWVSGSLRCVNESCVSRYVVLYHIVVFARGQCVKLGVYRDQISARAPASAEVVFAVNR